MKRYDILLADVDGTLMDFDAAETKALAAACQAMALTITPEQIQAYKHINDALWQAFERREVTQEALKTLRFERFLQTLGAERDPVAMAAAFMAALSEQTDEIDGAEAFLREASARAPVVLVTNGIGSVQRGRWGRSRLAKYVTAYVISGEVGFAKPDPRMIELALARAGRDGAALMLGDEPRSDIAAANAAGVDGCWFNPTGRVNGTEHVPTHEVRALAEVLAWL